MKLGSLVNKEQFYIRSYGTYGLYSVADLQKWLLWNTVACNGKFSCERVSMCITHIMHINILSIHNCVTNCIVLNCDYEILTFFMNSTVCLEVLVEKCLFTIALI